VALNIGQINFGVAADTKGLRKAISEIGKFQKATDKLARSSEKGAQAAVKAREANTRALQKQLRATIDLRKAMLASGMDKRSQEVRQVSSAFALLRRRVTSSKTATHEVGRAFDAFSHSLAKSKTQLKAFNQAQEKGGVGLKKYSVLLRDLESSAVLALGPLSGLGARIRSVSAIIMRGALPAGALWFAGIAGLVVGLTVFGAKIITVGDRIQGLKNRFEAATGSMAKGRKELQFTANLANRLGLSMEVLGKSYSRFLAASQGTNLEGAKARKIFTQVARAAAALKLSGADVEGVMRAIEQIMSKGTVQAEELRGQLGDRLPGAFRIAAEAMGVSTRELNRMLKAGEVISDEFLPKFGDGLEGLGSKAERNLDTVGGAFSVMGNNFVNMFNRLNEASGASVLFSKLIQSLANQIPYASEQFTDLSGASVKVVSAWQAAQDAAAEVKKEIPPLTMAFTKQVTEVDKVAKELFIMRDAVWAVGRSSKSVEFLKDYFTALAPVAKLNATELKSFADRLWIITGMRFPETAEGIAEGIAEVARMSRKANEEFQRMVAAPQALEDANTTLDSMAARLAALHKGPEALDIFENITEPAEAFRKVLEATNEDVNTQNDMWERFKAIITETIALEAKLADAKSKATKEANKRASAENKMNEALAVAKDKIKQLRLQTAALATGPESLEIFEKVEAPIARMAEAFRKAGFEMSVVRPILDDYRDALEDMLQLTNRWARAGTSAANAIVNGFERIITRSGDVKDVLRDLARELLKIIIRVGFLDNIQGVLSGIFRGSPVPAPTGHPDFNPAMEFASGGSFKIRGSGGSDNVPVSFMAKAGETVSVRRGDQMGGGDGGGLTINISAPGADAGTIARLKEIVRSELAPQIIQASTDHTMARLRRPGFA